MVQVFIVTHVMGLDREPEDAWHLALPATTGCLRDLIRAKVMHEMAGYAAGRRRMVRKEYLALDELAAFQVAAGRGAVRRLEVEEQVRKAFKAFEEGDYIVTVDRREIHDLDAPVTVEPGARVQFLRLLPVAGGASPCRTGAGGRGSGGP